MLTHSATRVVLCSLLFSPFSYASIDLVHKLDAQIIVAAFCAVLLLSIGIWLWLRARVKRQQSQIAQLNEQTQAKQALLDGFNLGMLHLDEQGSILYINRIAAFWLGSKAQDLTGKLLSNVLQGDAADKLLGALSCLVDCKTQWYCEKHQRHILLGAHPLAKPKDQLAMVVTLQDVTYYQAQIDTQQRQWQVSCELNQRAGIGKLDINLKEKLVRLDKQMMTWLALTDPEQSLDSFRSKLDSSCWANWQIALEQGGEQGQLSLSGVLASQSGPLPVTLLGQVVKWDSEHKPLNIHLQVSDQLAFEQAKQQLKAARNQFKALLGASAQPLYLLDSRGCFSDCNLAFQRLFGINQMQVQGKTPAEAGLFDEAINTWQQSSDLALSSMVGQGREFNLTLKDGKVHPLRFRLQPLKDSEGNSGGLLGQIEDLSELRAMQAQVEHKQQQLEQFLQHSPLAIALMDEEEHLRQANNLMLKRFGYSEPELNKLSLYQLFSEPGQAARAAKQLQKGNLDSFHASLKDKQGKLHPSEIFVQSLGQGQHLCWIADVSEKAFQQDKFDNLLEHSSLAMAVLTDTGFSRLNPAACAYFGIQDEQQLFGFYPYSEGLNTDAEAAARLKQKLDQLKQDGKALSLVWQHQHGHEALPCQATYVPMFKGGVLDSVLCIWMDMRAIHQAAAERLEAINLRQAAERQMAEQQQLLQNSQDQLASKAKSLVDTQSKLQSAEQNLSQQQSQLKDLQQAHQSVTENLQKLQQDYSDSRAQLADSQRDNAELEEQLAQSSSKVGALEKQRNDIADALQHSERQFQRAQQQLRASEEASNQLKAEQGNQAQRMQQLVEQNNSLKQSMGKKDQQIAEVSGQISSLQSQLLSSAQASESLREQLANQRKASEQAQQQHRETEQRCRLAQAELSNKLRHIEHLQYEMQKVEEMSHQQRDDLEEQHKALQQELQAKQQQLQDTQQALDETRKQSELEKQEKAAKQADLNRLQQELNDMQAQAGQQQQQAEQADQLWRQQQQALQAELQHKQQQLQQAEAVLADAKQQTEAEKAEKARQQQVYAQLQAELKEVEQRAAKQQAQISQSDQQWQSQQQTMQAELAAKQQQLQDSQARLDAFQRQADEEKQQRLEQQMKLEQLKVELTDVEGRATRQKEMMQGSDEQWRQHQAEIEAQKQQLQQALEQARQQNLQMEDKLKDRLAELQRAESQVQQNQSGEQKLQHELEQARQAADALQARLAQQEAQEVSLQQQLASQQQVLKDSEQNIHKLEQSQASLTAQLQQVQQQYEQSRKQLSDQGSSQSDLNQRLQQLEDELQQNRAQLDSKENALQQAQQALQSSQLKMAEQEQALVDAHRQELQQARSEQVQVASAKPAIVEQPMPDNPAVWFDLLPYLQKNPQTGSLAAALTQLMQALEDATQQADTAINNEDTRAMLQAMKRLVALAEQINSEPLVDLTSRLEAAGKLGHLDSISIFWPNVKRSLITTMRVIYSHLEG
ncbi:hypothetical protein GCM10009092_21420 [Bowmanella denitrificans]|uniref:PAS domain-containing protein n=1 Tax=Bowmanella denitrificans TaxID=366582 RepID=A0ABN0X781_9ALTE